MVQTKSSEEVRTYIGIRIMPPPPNDKGRGQTAVTINDKVSLVPAHATEDMRWYEWGTGWRMKPAKNLAKSILMDYFGEDMPTEEVLDELATIFRHDIISKLDDDQFFLTVDEINIWIAELVQRMNAEEEEAQQEEQKEIIPSIEEKVNVTE